MPTIGQPIANTEVFILDENLCQVAPGEAGELYIGGMNVARGYRNRPDLTAEKFICDPFSDGRGARLYRTGDLARYLPNGDIAYLGRADEQIKILGYRIEPIGNRSCYRSTSGYRRQRRDCPWIELRGKAS